MKRNIEKAYSDYLKLREKNPCVDIYLSDIYSLSKMTNDSLGEIVSLDFTWDLMVKSWGIGVMLGYRLAKREQRKRNGASKNGKAD